MSAATTRSKGVLGVAAATPDQGGLTGLGTLNQSCPTADNGRSIRFRISLPSRHAKRWLALPRRLREQIAGIAFGAFTEGFKLDELAAVASELRLARLALNNVLQLTLCADTPLDAKRIDAALDRINAILGERTP
jgi:hypothetical protein